MMTLHFTVDPSAQAHGTDAAPPAAPTDLASCPAPSEKIFFFLFFRNHVLISPSRLDWRGVSRSSRTWKRDAVDVSGCSALVARTNNPGRTAKSYGPDIPVLMSSRRAVSTNAPTTGAKKPVPEESTYKPFKPLRREAGYLADPVVLPRAFLLHADHGYQRIPGLPCALSLKEGHMFAKLGLSMPRERAGASAV
jgi:hypothetical protein